MVIDSQSVENLSAEVADYRVWQLVLFVSPIGLEAIYYNHSTGEVRHRLSSKWECSEEEMLHRLQEAVYEASSMLTDHKVVVVIESKHFVITPGSSVGDDYECESLLEMVHSCKGDDVWVDRVEDMAIAYSFVKGLDSFLNRTFIVENTLHHLTPLIGLVLSQGGDSRERMVVDIRRGRVDIVVARGDKLLIANTFEWKEDSDVTYHILNVVRLCQLNQQSVMINLYGDKDIRTKISPVLRKFVTYVVPSSMGNVSDIPLSISVIANKK